MLDVKKSEAPA